MKKIAVNLGKRSHNILIGYGCLKEIGKYIRSLNHSYDSIFIITSPRIGKLYASTVAKSIKDAGYRYFIVEKLPDGDKNKNLINLNKFYGKINKFDTEDKKLLVLNLGGGVVGDFGGFLAGTWKRGVDYIQVPTTLLGMVDCGIGGKTGVNFKNQKNYIGMFYQPKLVFADLSVLRTLNKRELRSGLAEVIKYGIISDPCIFDKIERHYDKVLNLDKKLIEYLSETTYKIKVAIVERDEEDKTGIRAVLNYGHTVGHAVEAASNYAYRHGEAIAVGMVAENDIAVKLKILKRDDADRIEDLINKIGLPTKIKNCNLTDIMDLIKKDKKIINGVNRFILAQKIGKVIIREAIDNRIIRNVIKSRLSG